MKASEKAIKRFELNEVISNLANEYADKLINIGIPVQKESIVVVELGKMSNCHGYCDCWTEDDKVKFEIKINDRLVLYSENDGVMDRVKDTICHELIHTCPNCQTHNDAWIDYCNKCDNAFGTHTRRCIEDKVYYGRTKETVYRYVCSDCGDEYLTTQNHDAIICNTCGKIIKKK